MKTMDILTIYIYMYFQRLSLQSMVLYATISNSYKGEQLAFKIINKKPLVQGMNKPTRKLKSMNVEMTKVTNINNQIELNLKPYAYHQEVKIIASAIEQMAKL